MVVYLQLTAATTAVITKLASSVDNELALRQFVAVGILLEFESLISCHGDELGMLEDMDVGMHDLAGVKFIITSQSQTGVRNACTTVSVSGNRSEFAAFTSIALFCFSDGSCSVSWANSQPQCHACPRSCKPSTFPDWIVIRGD